MKVLLTDVALSVRYSLALLKDLPALKTSCIPKDKPAFERLRQERRRVYEAIQAYVKWIFEPTIDLAMAWNNETAELGEQALHDELEDQALHDELEYLKEQVEELRNQLTDFQWSETYHEPQNMGTMPSRSPWEIYIACLVLEEFFSDRMKRVEAQLTNSHFKPPFSNIKNVAKENVLNQDNLNGGIPPMTFFTVHGLGQHPTVVLGFSATAWADSALHAWAKKCRDQDLAKHEHSRTMERRKNAVKVMKKAKCQVGEGGWTTSVITDTIVDFRKRSNRKPFPRGPRGMALAFPKLKSRARCPACLCSTEFRVTAEDGLEIADIVGSGKIWGPSCAEVEAMIVIEQLERKSVNHLTRMVSALKRLFSTSRI
ncbi:MAG: hypothetical protein Q9209_007615 [Squamulea sp. 1 TL-2023]